MAQAPENAPGPKRLPLAAIPSNRDDTSHRDARLINAYIERTPTEETHIYKRPGFWVDTTVTASTARGVYVWHGDTYTIYDGEFYKNGVAVGAVDNAGLYSFNQNLAAIQQLFFHNATHAYTYDPTNGLVAVASATTVITTGTLNSSAVITLIPDTSGIAEGAGVEGAGIPPATSVLTVDSPTQVTLDFPATINAAASPLTFTNVGFSQSAVPGAAYLDGTMYVMDTLAGIMGSGLNDLATWEALNRIVAQIEPDGGVCLAKQLVYVVAFKEWSTEMFYDAGNPAASPLAPVQGTKVNYGCRHAGSVQDINGRLIWVASTKSGAVSARVLEGMRETKLSYPAVDRLLESADYTTVWSWQAKVAGHTFYVVTFPVSNLSLACDVDLKTWYHWTDTAGNYLPFISSTVTPDQRPLLQHATNGGLYRIDQAYTSDDTGLIPVDIYTPNFDGEVRTTKHLWMMEIIADQDTGNSLTVRVSDDDYQTWTVPRKFDLGQVRPYITDCGSFRRRAFNFHHAADYRLRLRAVELRLNLGTL